MYLVSHYAGEQMDGLEQMRVLSSLVRIIGSLGGVGSRNSLLSSKNLFLLKKGQATSFFGGFVICLLVIWRELTGLEPSQESSNLITSIWALHVVRNQHDLLH